MENENFNHQTVRDLIILDYYIIVADIPEKIQGNIWEYLDMLDEKQEMLVLEDLLKWIDSELALINKDPDLLD